MVFLGVLQGVAYQLHSQRLQLDLLHRLLLQRQLGYRHHSLREVLHSIIHVSHAIPHALLFLQRLVELQHIEVGHEQEVVRRGFLQGLHDEVIHVGQIVEQECRSLIEEDQGWVQLVQSNQGFQDGHQQLDDIVQLEYPDESDFRSSPEDVVVGDFPLLAGVVQLLVGGELHEVVVEGDEQFLADEGLHVLGLGLDLVVLVLAGLREDLYLLAQDDIADVVFADLADLDEHHHDLQLAAGCALLLELLYQRLQQRLLPPILRALLEETHAFRNDLDGEAVAADAQPLELLGHWVLLEEGIY